LASDTVAEGQSTASPKVRLFSSTYAHREPTHIESLTKQLLFGADARETQLDAPERSSGPRDDIPPNGGDLRIGQFVMG